MPSAPGDPAVGAGRDDVRGLGRLFALIVIVEILSILALYWFGRSFS